MSTREGDSTSGTGVRRGPLALPAAGLRLAAALTARPVVLVARGVGWAVELGRVGLGRPADPGMPTDPIRRRAAQAFQATVEALSGLLDDAAQGPHSPFPPEDAERLREVLSVLSGLQLPPWPGAGAPAAHEAPPATPDRVQASTPVVVPGSPDEAGTGSGLGTDPAAVLERIFTAPGPGDPGVPFDTGARDAGGGPVPGRDVAATPGAVVLRTPIFELIQYLPATERVHDTPVLVVPPLRHRYWLADLAPGYSLVEHLVGRGLQVFTLSWRPAGPADDGRDLDAHAAAVLDALEACTRIARAPRVTMLGVRSGGLLAAAVQAHQAETGLDDRVAAVGYLGTVLDPDTPPVRDEPGAARTLAWDDDGGRGHASRALLAWARDLLPVPSSLRGDLAELAGNALGSERGLRVLGTPVRPGELRRDGYVLAAADAPDRPWADGLRTARMLGGPCRLVRAGGDQAGVLIAPPRVSTSFRVAPCAAGDGDPEAWTGRAEVVEGSWWDDLADWLIARSGTLRDAPPELGGRRLPALFPAPGTYLSEGTAGQAAVSDLTRTERAPAAYSRR